jgi:dipeptidyl aminopeptidase/acylaminoacyl peptidase
MLISTFMVAIRAAGVLFFVISSVALGAHSETRVAELNAKLLVERARLGGDGRARFTLSPAGDAIAVQLFEPRVGQNDYVISWYVFELGDDASLVVDHRVVDDGGELMLNIRQEQLTNGGIAGSAAKWSPDARWIAYAKRAEGAIQLWRARRDGMTQEQLTNHPANVLGDLSYQALFEWSIDGSKLYYEVARSRVAMEEAMAEEGRRGYLYDERFVPSYSYSPFWMRCGTERRGEKPVASQQCEPSLWVHDLASGDDRLATTSERVEYQQIVAGQGTNYAAVPLTSSNVRKFMPRVDDGTIIWLENVNPKTYSGSSAPMRLMMRALGGADRTCEAEACASKFISAAWKVGDEIVFLRRTGQMQLESVGSWAFYAWSPETGAAREILRTTDYFSDCKPARGYLICFHETPIQPRELVSLDIHTGAVVELFDANPRIEPSLFTRVEHIERTDDLGRITIGELVYPKGYEPGQRYPLVWVEGSDGFLAGGTGDEYPIHLLADQGFFVYQGRPYADYDLSARLQGWDRSVAEFADFQLRKWALAAFTDIISELDRRGLVDPKRVGVTGLSSGSVNARYGLIHSDLFAASAMSTGYSGPQMYWFNSSAESRRRWRETFVGGRPPFEPETEAYMAGEQLGWHARGRGFPPVLWQVSDAEMSTALFDHALLKDEGQPVEMYVFPGEHHVKFQPAHKYAVYRRNVQWFKFWLQGEEVDDPVDVTQYGRWEAMCRTYVEGLKASDDPADDERAAEQRCSLQL